MKLTALFVVFLAGCVSVVRVNAGCEETDALNCLQGFKAAAENPTEENVCGALETAHDCLIDLTLECQTDDDAINEVIDDLQPVRDVLEEHCEKKRRRRRGEPQMSPCVESNKDYISSCVEAAALEAVESLTEQGVTDETEVRCTILGVILECLEDRVEEKCGFDEKLQFAHAVTTSMPEEISANCYKK